MPAASRKGNKSGPLVLPEGQGSGRGRMGYIIHPRRRCFASKAGRRIILLLSTEYGKHYYSNGFSIVQRGMEAVQVVIAVELKL